MKLNLNEVGVIWVSKGGKLRQLKYYKRYILLGKDGKGWGSLKGGPISIFVCYFESHLFSQISCKSLVRNLFIIIKKFFLEF